MSDHIRSRSRLPSVLRPRRSVSEVLHELSGSPQEHPVASELLGDEQSAVELDSTARTTTTRTESCSSNPRRSSRVSRTDPATLAESSQPTVSSSRRRQSDHAQYSQLPELDGRQVQPQGLSPYSTNVTTSPTPPTAATYTSGDDRASTLQSESDRDGIPTKNDREGPLASNPDDPYHRHVSEHLKNLDMAVLNDMANGTLSSSNISARASPPVARPFHTDSGTNVPTMPQGIPGIPGSTASYSPYIHPADLQPPPPSAMPPRPNAFVPQQRREPPPSTTQLKNVQQAWGEWELERMRSPLFSDAGQSESSDLRARRVRDV